MNSIKIEKLNDEQKKELNIPDECIGNENWSVWECAPSSFDWHYDSVELAYVYEGKVKVKTADGEVEINAGDFVTFPEGLSCNWNVLEKIRKVYQFK